MPYTYCISAVTSAGSYVWTAPRYVNEVYIQAWGGGGAGGGQAINSDGGGGGGGGAYAAGFANVTPLTNYNLCVGSGGAGVAGGIGGTGGDSWFLTTTCIMAKGGSGGCPSTGTPPPGGCGGLASASCGTTRYSGGQGNCGRNQSTGIGSFGGSSAGCDSDGFSGSQSVYCQNFPVGSEPTCAGIGGNGGGAQADGNPPASGYGGGGGGAGECSTTLGATYGGDGYQGRICMCWYVFTPTVTIISG